MTSLRPRARPLARPPLAAAACAALIVALTSGARAQNALYGRIGSIVAAPGHGAELAQITATAAQPLMPGNLDYVVALDAKDPDLVWVTEVWTDKASHDASLDLPAVREAIARARPLIHGAGQSVETRPQTSSK